MRKPSSVNNAKKQRKTRERERRDLFKKIRDTKGTVHAKIGTIKDRSAMDLTGAELLRRGSKNTHKNYTKRILMTQVTMMVYSLT